MADFHQENRDSDIHYTIVNEAGASVYSASKLADGRISGSGCDRQRRNVPGQEAPGPAGGTGEDRPTKSIGVGQYQHDINQGLLERCFDQRGGRLRQQSRRRAQHRVAVAAGSTSQASIWG